MNVVTRNACRDLSCGAAAILITATLGLAFLQSTSVPPGARTRSALHLTAIQPQHAWFGQPEPAVLVD